MSPPYFESACCVSIHLASFSHSLCVKLLQLVVCMAWGYCVKQLIFTVKLSRFYWGKKWNIQHSWFSPLIVIDVIRQWMDSGLGFYLIFNSRLHASDSIKIYAFKSQVKRFIAMNFWVKTTNHSLDWCKIRWRPCWVGIHT